MLEIDGAQGEGGGQIIRSSLALSAVTGKSIRLRHIRAGRSKPGLKRQHLTCVNAAAEICDANVEGAELNATEFTFQPSTIRGGDYHFQVGTAGSTTLVAQTLLPALALANEPSTVTIKGGTHNPWAPPFDFLQRCYLPLLERTGPTVTAELQSHGFYPSGGGGFTLDITPCKTLSGLHLLQRGGKPEPTVTAVVAGIPADIGERECDTIRRKMAWSQKCTHVIDVKHPNGQGNVVMIELASPYVSELFIGIGKLGVKAETVAKSVLREAKRYLATEIPVGEYLADQLMMPMGLAASQGETSSFRTSELSMNSKTHIAILKTFLDISIDVDHEDDGTRVVTFAPSS